MPGTDFVDGRQQLPGMRDYVRIAKDVVDIGTSDLVDGGSAIELKINLRTMRALFSFGRGTDYSVVCQETQ
jgi:hypothetical protein